MPSKNIPILKWRIILKSIATNYSALLKQYFHKVDTLSGSIHLKKDPEMAKEYAKNVIMDYFRAGDITKEDIMGARILEAGPGDNLGVALILISLGADKVVCVDKFKPKRDRKFEFTLYSLLREELDEKSKKLFDRAIFLKDDNFEINKDKIEYITGYGIEDADEILKDASFDIIVSRAVLQYIHRIDKAFETMDRLLKNGGKMIHFIDLRDVGTFSGASKDFHPLTFLTVPDPIWTLMSSHTPRPNRKRISYYLQKMEEFGYTTKIGIYRVFGNKELLPEYATRIEEGVHYHKENLELISSIRPNLAKPFKKLGDKELLPAGIVLSAIKPK